MIVTRAGFERRLPNGFVVVVPVSSRTRQLRPVFVGCRPRRREPRRRRQRRHRHPPRHEHEDHKRQETSDDRRGREVRRRRRMAGAGAERERPSHRREDVKLGDLAKAVDGQKSREELVGRRWEGSVASGGGALVDDELSASRTSIVDRFDRRSIDVDQSSIVSRSAAVQCGRLN